MVEYVFYADSSIDPGILRAELPGARDSHWARVIADALCVACS